MSAYYCLHFKDWHRVDVGNGQVEGLGKARFAYSKRGKLYIKSDGAIPEEALRDGSRLAFIRTSRPQPQFKSTSIQTVEKVDASIQTSLTPIPVEANVNDKRSDTINTKQPTPKSVKRRNSIPYDPDVPPTKKRRLSYNVPQLTKNVNTDVPPPKKRRLSNNIHKSTKNVKLAKDIKKVEHQVAQKKNLKHVEDIRKPETKTAALDVIINDEEIDLIRTYLMNTCDSFDLLQFDQGGNYQIQCLILFTPLVILERCPEISRMLDKEREQSEDEISQKDFVSLLGLKSVLDKPSPKRYKMRQAIRQNKKQDTRQNKEQDTRQNKKQDTRLKTDEEYKSKGNEYTTESESDSETEFRKETRKKTKNVTKLAKKSLTPRKIITRNISAQSKDSDTDSLFPEIRHSARLGKKNHKPAITSDDDSDQENINKAPNKVDLTISSDDSDETNDIVENNNKSSDNNIQTRSKNRRFLKTRSLNTLEPKIKPVTSADNDKKTINEINTRRKLLKANKPKNVVNTNSEDEFVTKPKQNRKNKTNRIVHADNPQDSNKNLTDKPKDNNINNLTDDENSDKEFRRPITRSRPNGKLDMENDFSPKPLAQSSKNATIQSLDSSDDTEIQEVKKNKIIDKIKSITARRLSTSSSLLRVEYSSLEDHAIVTWVSCGGRARCVNGNRIWRELEEDYHKITGQNRSWHSLRNRYLRSILQRLDSMALDPILVRRLRAAASTGEIKSRGISRRNSIFGVPVRGALSRRARRSPSEEIMPSKRHKHDGRRQVSVSPPARELRSSVNSPDKNKRSPRYSEITRRFVANYKDASDSSTPVSREISPVLESSRNVAENSRNSPKSDDMFPETKDLSPVAQRVTRNSLQTKRSLRNSMVTKKTVSDSLETKNSKETEDKRKLVRNSLDIKSSSPNKMANSSPRRKSQRNRSVSPEVSKTVKTRRKSLKDKFEESKSAKTQPNSPVLEKLKLPLLERLKSPDSKIQRRNSLREDAFDLSKSLARNLARRSVRTMSVDFTKVVATKSKQNSKPSPTASTSKFVKSATNDESKLQRKNDQQKSIATKSRTRKLYNPTGFL